MSTDYGPLIICPGVGRYTRDPGTVWGTDARGTKPGTPQSQQPGPVRPDAQGNKPIWEWQWAQTAMYAYYFAHFMSNHGTNGFVLSEAQYAFLLTGIDLADSLLDKLSIDFRRDYAAGGRLRPDILGFHVGPAPGSYLITLEILEVSTAKQARKTYKEDLLYKVGKLVSILRGSEDEIARAFSAPPKFRIDVGPAKWKPHSAYQRVVPLPLREEEGVTYVEWICFQPTFVQNEGMGTDGLLLYEIHSLPLKHPSIPKEVLKQIAENEKRQRAQQQVAYGLTLTPWLTTQYLDSKPLDRDQMQALAIVAGIGLIACMAVVAAPAIAGLELGALLGEAGLVGRAAAMGRNIVDSGRLIQAARGLQATMQTTMQWASALGRPVALAP